jgi:hypothetical protein
MIQKFFEWLEVQLIKDEVLIEKLQFDENINFNFIKTRKI